MESLKVVTRVLDFVPASIAAKAAQDDAQTQQLTWNRIVSTDPPYYDNIRSRTPIFQISFMSGYADHCGPSS
jgi:adenine-specific DNA methylase